MLYQRKKRNLIVIISFFSVILLILLQNTQIAFADENNNLEIDNLNFQMLEYSEDKGTIENINSINISLPSSTWNVT
ncbi:MAG: hypothetical protein EU532_10115, partial [Promethearchaeota archaeon]